MTRLARALRNYRETTSTSQAELARRCGVSREYIALIESGRRRNVCPLTRVAAARSIGWSPGAFLSAKERGILYP